jgi:hypothetical protein
MECQRLDAAVESVRQLIRPISPDDGIDMPTEMATGGAQEQTS